MLETIKDKFATTITLPWKRWLTYALIALCSIVGLIFAYNRFFPQKVITATPQVAPQAKQVEDVPQIAIPGPKKLIVYKRDQIIKKIPLPAEVQNNANNQFTAAVQVPVSPYGGTATAFTNISTGKTDIVVSSKERPFFGFGGETNFVALAGVSTKGDFLLGGIDQPIIRTGPITIGAFGGGGILGGGGLLGAGISAKW